jgi:hypothetical protein
LSGRADKRPCAHPPLSINALLVAKKMRMAAKGAYPPYKFRWFTISSGVKQCGLCK